MAKKIDLNLATPQQIKEIQRDINHLEGMLLADKQSRSPKIQQPEEVLAEIREKKKLIQNFSPKPLRGKSKDKAWKRVKELDALLQEHMPTSRDYYQRYPKNNDCNSDFERAVKQQMAFQKNPALQRAALERKYWMGRLEPEDPTIRSVENIRR